MVKKAKNEIIDGEVLEAFPNTMFKVKLTNGREILTTLKGSMRKRYVRVFPGDRVSVELTGFDEDRGRIVYKY